MEENKLYDRLKYYLNNTIEAYADEDELKRICAIRNRIEAWRHNKGIRFERTKTNERELAFYEQWMEENEPQTPVNDFGILQDLFIEKGNPFSILDGGKCIEEINNRDRMIVATIIQWLGSNVGMCFLGSSLKRFGARIIYDEKPNSEQNPERSVARDDDSSTKADNQIN